MNYRIALALLAGVFGAAVIHAPAAAVGIEPLAAADQQCRWETPAQYGPRAALRPPVRVCETAAPRRGHYELYWPHWLAQRALPPVRIWVEERR